VDKIQGSNKNQAVLIASLHQDHALDSRVWNTQVATMKRYDVLIACLALAVWVAITVMVGPNRNVEPPAQTGQQPATPAPAAP
jgi:hypothetical protein